MQISIVISFDNGKESKAQRKLRIAETHNGDPPPRNWG